MKHARHDIHELLVVIQVESTIFTLHYCENQQEMTLKKLEVVIFFKIFS